MISLKNSSLIFSLFLWVKLPKISSENVPAKRYNLTMCAMLRDEMPYILEWIEHHRLQGVDRFFLYDDDSRDSTRMIPLLYQSMGFEGLIEMLPVNPYRKNQQVPHTGAHHDEKQMLMLDHCNRRCAGDSEWIMVVDVDEFMFSPKDQTVWDYIESIKSQTDPLSSQAISQLSVTAVRYGTSGVQKNFQGEITLQPYNETLQITIKNPENPTEPGFPMITLANPNRAPHPDLDKDYDIRHAEVCKSRSNPGDCQHAWGKPIWKPGRCDMAGVHQCEKGLKGRVQGVSIGELRLNHYAFKTREHVEGLLDLMKPTKLRVYENFDGAWFSSRFDPMPARITDRLKEALKKFIL